MQLLIYFLEIVTVISRQRYFRKEIDFHKAKIGDLDGDGDMDILDKPLHRRRRGWMCFCRMERV